VSLLSLSRRRRLATVALTLASLTAVAGLGVAATDVGGQLHDGFGRHV
jgi:hypothetical protein